MNENTPLHEEVEQPTEQAAEQTNMQAGDLLRQQRISLGMSQKQVADRLRLREGIIVAIDRNEFDLGQVDTFVKGYLRSYAKVVGLSEHDVLAAFEQHNASAQGDSAMQSFSRKTKHEKNDNNLMRLTYVIVLVLIGISSLWWWQSQQNNELVVEETAMSELAEPTPEVDPAFQVEEPNTVSINNNEPASPSIDREAQQREAATVEQGTDEIASETLTEDPAIEQAEPAVEQVGETSEPPQQTEPIVEEQPAPQPVVNDAIASNTLFMNFTADCWIQVKDASGKTLATGVKTAGQSLTLEGTKPYDIILGAPEGVEMRLASEPVDLSGYTAGKVAKFTLP